MVTLEDKMDLLTLLAPVMSIAPTARVPTFLAVITNPSREHHGQLPMSLLEVSTS